MGFNKRYINEENIKSVHKQGHQQLVDYVTKPDALIISDDFSRKIVDLIVEGDSEQKIKTLMKK